MLRYVVYVRSLSYQIINSSNRRRDNDVWIISQVFCFPTIRTAVRAKTQGCLQKYHYFDKVKDDIHLHLTSKQNNRNKIYLELDLICLKRWEKSLIKMYTLFTVFSLPSFCACAKIWSVVVRACSIVLAWFINSTFIQI